MDVNYWNGFAHKYDQLITDAFTYGRSKAIAKQIDRFASLERDVADFGCGPGKLLPLLSRKFRKVYAYDFSDRLLEVAAKRCQGLGNVVIANADLAQPVEHLPTIDVAVSLNAVIMPDTQLRLQFLRGMASRINPGGHLILNVPSVESLLYSQFRETELFRKRGHSTRRAEAMTDVSSLTEPKLMAKGVLNRGGELTKHYLREELVVLVKEEMRLHLIEILKMEYDWTTDLERKSVPDWMRDPYPWDWLVIAQA